MTITSDYIFLKGTKEIMLKKYTFLLCLILMTLGSCLSVHAKEPGTAMHLPQSENAAALLFPAFARFEAGESIAFSSIREYYNFFEQYLTQYRLEDLKGGYPLTGMETSIPDERRYDRESVRQHILTLFSLTDAMDPRETIEEVCRQIRSTIRYDQTASGLTLEEALASGCGVCWHYVKIADVVLEDSGIPTEIIHGSVLGTPHMWLRCQTGTQWLLADPQIGILPGSCYEGRYLPYPYLSVLRE